MAKNSQPIAKRCKTLNVSPTAMGYAKKNTNRNPKGGLRRKQSEYGEPGRDRDAPKNGVARRHVEKWFSLDRVCGAID